MSLRATKNDPSALTNELVSARADYNQRLQSILDRAQDRRNVIGSTISDLKSEDDALAGVVEQARQG